MVLVQSTDQWIQFDLGEPRWVMGIAVLGRQIAEQYIKVFRMAVQNQPGDITVEWQVGWHADDDPAWESFDTGLSDGTYNMDVAFLLITEPIFGRYVRINPLSWRGYIAGRFDILVNDAVRTPVAPP